MGPELRPGRMAFYKGAAVDVVELVFHDSALIGIDGNMVTVKRRELIPMADPLEVLAETAIAAIPQSEWDKAKARTKAIRYVLSQEYARTVAVKDMAPTLGLSERQFWRLVRDYERHHTVSGMIKRSAGRRVGMMVLHPEIERVIAEKVESYYLQSERPTVTALHERVAAACREQGLHPPTRATVNRRVRHYQTRSAQRRRVGSKKAKYLFEPMPGHVKVSRPLERVEIDHTPMDVMVRSDDPYCDYVGRPWLTVAIDVFTRCILGIHIGFEAPSILSVALCLTHAVLPKDPAAEFRVPLEWPMCGLPHEIVVDNGRDFVSAAFQRGCDEHGILLSYRPVGSPHYGGSTPSPRTLQRSLMMRQEECHGTAKKVQRGIQA